jgi:HSP20 family protein
MKNSEKNNSQSSKKSDTEEKENIQVQNEEELKPSIVRPLDIMTDIDQWFNRMWRGFDDFMYKPYRLMEMPSMRVPVIDVVEEKDKYEITAEIPGIQKEEVDINLKKDIIEISAEHKEQNEIKKENFIRRERSRNIFYRKIPLPNNVDKKGIEATLNNGIISLTLPKVEPSLDEQSTKINIK